jgi:FkbM family methyltransferase
MTERNLLTQSRGFNRCVLAREGYVLYNPNDLYVGRSIERYGEWSELESEVLRQLCVPGGIVVEVGSNIGAHTLVLAQCVTRTGFVYAYEPQRIVFQALCANLALNSIVNVDARHAAVGAGSGWLTFPDIDYTYPANYSAIEIGRFPEGRPVRLVTLDEELDLERLDLVKVDVEGMELDVLKGASALIERFRPVLYLENDRAEKSAPLIRLLFDLGYRLYWHRPPLYNPGNFFKENKDEFPELVSVNMLCLPRERPQNIGGMNEVTDETEKPLPAAGQGSRGR